MKNIKHAAKSKCKRRGDTRFVLEVRSTTKVVYVSVEELTKSQVSFNHNPPKLPPMPTQFSLSIPTKRRLIQTSP
jgi:hypothetical protein